MESKMLTGDATKFLNITNQAILKKIKPKNLVSKKYDNLATIAEQMW